MVQEYGSARTSLQSHIQATFKVGIFIICNNNALDFTPARARHGVGHPVLYRPQKARGVLLLPGATCGHAYF